VPDDIFIDNNVAKNFANPLDDEYKELIKWLFDVGWLVVSKKLLIEYSRTCGMSTAATNIGAIINQLTRNGRLNNISNADLANLKFKPRIEKSLRCNHSDRDHLKTVLLSDRRYAISLDNKLRHDINNYPGVNARAEARPNDLPYK
jgi:hypothetical protein